jgi:preprotein translocase subunit SecE
MFAAGGMSRQGRMDEKMAKATAADSPLKTDKPAKTGKPGKAPAPAKPNVFARLATYFRDVRAEMKRVVWPSRQEVRSMWIVVIVALIFFIAYIALTDTIVVYLLGLVGKIKIGG